MRKKRVDPGVEQQVKELFVAGTIVSVEIAADGKSTYVSARHGNGVRFETLSFLMGMHAICAALGCRDGDLVEIDKEVVENQLSSWTIETDTTYSVTMSFW